jgi:hypothetical protein
MFDSKFVELDVDHKVMGTFNPCRFEMLQIHQKLDLNRNQISHPKNISHSSSHFK